MIKANHITTHRLRRREAIAKLQQIHGRKPAQTTELRTCLGCGARHPFNQDGTPNYEATTRA